MGNSIRSGEGLSLGDRTDRGRLEHEDPIRIMLSPLKGGPRSRKTGLFQGFFVAWTDDPLNDPTGSLDQIPILPHRVGIKDADMSFAAGKAGVRKQVLQVLRIAYASRRGRKIIILDGLLISRTPE